MRAQNWIRIYKPRQTKASLDLGFQIQTKLLKKFNLKKCIYQKKLAKRCIQRKWNSESEFEKEEYVE